MSEPLQAGERRGAVEEKFGSLARGRHRASRAAPSHRRLVRRRDAGSGAARRPRRPRLSRLVLEQQIAVDAEGGIHYPVGDLFDYNGPTLMVTRIMHKPEHTAEETIAAYDAVLDDVKQKGIEESELAPLKVKFRSDFVSMLEGGHGGVPRYGLMHVWRASLCSTTSRAW